MIESAQASIDELVYILENAKEQYILPIYEKHLANADLKEKEELIANKEQLIEQLFNNLLKRRVELLQERCIEISELTRTLKNEEHMKSLFEE